MFSFGSVWTGYPSPSVGGKKVSKKDDQHPTLPSQASSSLESFQTAIDGPPSPERIRAYMEQMKRGSIFANNHSSTSRTNTVSSASSSFHSRDSSSTRAEATNDLSRKSSARSTTSSMSSPNRERSGSLPFGSVFSRHGRRRRGDSREGLKTSHSSMSFGELATEAGSARDHYYGYRRRPTISDPYNFQHVTHTQKENIPNLKRASPTQLVSEFSAIRASQAPTTGELKGIRAEDLHFENFSSEAVNTTMSPEKPRSQSPRRRAFSQRSDNIVPHSVAYSKSLDNFRGPLSAPLPGPPPPRPPRSPLSPVCPVQLPPRTSSRTASVLYETFDPLAAASFERPYVPAGIRRPAPVTDFTASTTSQTRIESQEYVPIRPSTSNALLTPTEESWPLTGSSSGTFGVELADVQEEDEDAVVKRRSMIGNDLRSTQSMDELSRTSCQQARIRPETNLEQSSMEQEPIKQRRPLSSGFHALDDSWESDIDWCYENEVEADDNFNWVEENTPPGTHIPPPLELQVQDDERVYHGRFRPSVLLPRSVSSSELSPMSNASTISGSDPQTPAHQLHLHNHHQFRAHHPSNHQNSQHHIMPTKEPHSFPISPTLLIPADFQTQMEQDEMYMRQLTHGSASASNDPIFVSQAYDPSPYASFSLDMAADEAEAESSTTASYRSSDFSRGCSARSSSSTRISGLQSRASQDSTMLLSSGLANSQVAANVNVSVSVDGNGNGNGHSSLGSEDSLPDLVPSTATATATDLSEKLKALKVALRLDEDVGTGPGVGVAKMGGNADHVDDDTAAAPHTLYHQRKQSLHSLGTGVAITTSEPLPSWSKNDDTSNNDGADELDADVDTDMDTDVDMTSAFPPPPSRHPDHRLQHQAKERDHERKVSAPLVGAGTSSSPSSKNMTAMREFKGRARAHTAGSSMYMHSGAPVAFVAGAGVGGVQQPKRRGSYMLFPQV